MNKYSGEDAARTSLDAVRTALAAIRTGQFVIVADSTNRENEGDLVAAAELVTPESVAYLLRRTSGIICVGMDESRLAQLRIPLMVTENTDVRRTAFTVSVDFRAGTTTGVSAADRAATIAALADPARAASDFTRPGHVFPLCARAGGVLERPGHTEAAVDLSRLAGLSSNGLLCEVMNDDGTMARRPQLTAMAAAEGLPMITIEELIEYRWQHEKLVDLVATTTMPTPHGRFDLHCYRSAVDNVEHLAFVMGDVATSPSVLTRVHSECLTGEAFGSLRCDCGDQLDSALRQIAVEGRGVVVYLRGHEGRGIGLANKIRAYALQDVGCDTVDANTSLGLPADARDYRVAGQILRDLDVSAVRLLTNNQHKHATVAQFVNGPVTRIPLASQPRAENYRYLKTKELKFGHLFRREDVEI